MSISGWLSSRNLDNVYSDVQRGAYVSFRQIYCKEQASKATPIDCYGFGNRGRKTCFGVSRLLSLSLRSNLMNWTTYAAAV